MTFIDFCRERGVVLEHLPRVGQWERVTTIDKPNRKNGAVKFMGDHGFVQNHATMTAVEVWKPDDEDKPYDPAKLQREVKQANENRAQLAAKARARAMNILAACKTDVHPYLEAKGFKEARGNVFTHPDHERWLTGKKHESTPVPVRLLVIPMRDGTISGLQMIDPDGVKKFLHGQRSAGAEFIIDAKGIDLLCEGYATALSVREALAAIKIRYRIHVCFSAFNVEFVSKRLGPVPHVIVADNDLSLTGERYPKEAGIPYWMSDTVGEDANDFHHRRGLFALSQRLRETIGRAHGPRAGSL